jgi:hypothetical protein
VVIALPPIPKSPHSRQMVTSRMFSLDRDHRVDELADDLTLLFLIEHIRDDTNLNK